MQYLRSKVYQLGALAIVDDYSDSSDKRQANALRNIRALYVNDYEDCE